MRPLKSPLPAEALSTVSPFLQPTQEARIFRRVPAVQAVVAGPPMTPVAATFRCADAALRTWGPRCAAQGGLGFRDRPRSGRPPTVTAEVPTRLTERLKHDPLEPGALSSPRSWRERATTIPHATGVQGGRARGRSAFKKTPEGPVVPPAVSRRIPPHSPTATSHSPRWSLAPTAGKSCASLKRRPACGAVPCPARAGGPRPRATGSPCGRSPAASATTPPRGNARPGAHRLAGTASTMGCGSRAGGPSNAGPPTSLTRLSPTGMPERAASICLNAWRPAARRGRQASWASIGAGSLGRIT
jgi:hypothetical protein